MIVLLGSNHRSAPVEIRERMAFPEDRLRRALDTLLAQDAIDEAMILSTCNRVELLVRVNARPDEALALLRRFFCDERGISSRDLDRYSYQLVGSEAVGHLFRVAGSLDSMIVGEPQILGQVKQAYRVAREHGATGPVLERLLQHCLATAKRVRNETDIARNAVSVAFAAVELARKIFGDLGGRSALLLGAGKMSDLVARHLKSSGVDQLTVASRTYNSAVTAASSFGGHAVHWSDGIARLGQVDIVVSCTAAPRPILGKKQIAKAIRGRRGRPLFIIDIAVPRDIEPDVNSLDNVYLYDIDGLQSVVDSNLEERRMAAEQAEQIIAHEVEAFERWRQAQNISPVIVDLRESLLSVGRVEVERFRNRLGPLSGDQVRTVEELTRSIIQKILHRPIRHLRKSVERGDMAECSSTYREIFGLHREPAAGTGPADEAPRDDAAAPPGPHRLLRGGKED